MTDRRDSPKANGAAAGAEARRPHKDPRAVVLEPRPLVPPLRFGCVDPGIFRGSYPHALNQRFLKRLALRTVMSITPTSIDIEMNGVDFKHIECAGEGTKSKKKRGVPITYDIVQLALAVLHDKSLHPVYLHCLNGGQVTCLIVACYRRNNNWCLTSILEEFERFGEYDRADIQFIERFESL